MLLLIGSTLIVSFVFQQRSLMVGLILCPHDCEELHSTKPVMGMRL